jgi:hypothetical protein
MLLQLRPVNIAFVRSCRELLVKHVVGELEVKLIGERVLAKRLRARRGAVDAQALAPAVWLQGLGGRSLAH